VMLATTLVLGATKVWWYVARSGGIVAWGLSALAVLWGLALATRALGRKPPAPWLLDVHRFLGALTVIFVGVHLVGLAFDPWASFGIDELLVPMASSWKPAAVAWGIVAFYLLLAIEGTSLIKTRLPVKLWRGVHLTSYAMYAMATVHLLLSGTDRYNPVLRTTIVVSIGAVVFFTMYRLIGPGRAASVKPGAGSGGPRTPGSSRVPDAARAAGSSRIPDAARRAAADPSPETAPDASSDR
jgi:DMSO/TMAO reductase YedYZ heme-binding membrane subunit